MYPVPKTLGNKVAMILCFSFLLDFQFVKSQCIASGPNSPATASSVSFSGSDWSFNNPTYVFANDVNRSSATALIDLLSSETDYLQATDFGFSIPTAASICGIELNVLKRTDRNFLNLSYVTDNDVRLIKGGTLTPISSNQAETSKWPTTDTYSIYGDGNYLWGTSWSPSDINNSNFGISFSAKINDLASLLPKVEINYISITVYYLDPTILSAQSIQFHVANGAKNTAVLSWKPTDIEEAALFAVERSVNGTKWEALDGTPQKSTISPLLTFTDDQPLPGKSFYRLKKDGRVRRSQVFNRTSV